MEGGRNIRLENQYRLELLDTPSAVLDATRADPLNLVRGGR
jgi:hypothetical protein